MPDDQEFKLFKVTGTLQICEACLKGRGGYCHTPGCLFWLNKAPDIPIRPAIVDVFGAKIEEISK